MGANLGRSDTGTDTVREPRPACRPGHRARTGRRAAGKRERPVRQSPHTV
jgi:hypothetical protein